MSGALVRYDAMCHAITAAYEVDEVKAIRDKAMALETYARLAQNVEAERQACEIRLRAERKAGQLLRAREKAKGAREPGTHRGTTRSADVTASLADLGISRNQSSQWQKLAAIPEDEFERGVIANGASTTGLIHGDQPTVVSDDALWLWGRLHDFEKMGLLQRHPEEVLSTLSPVLLQETRRLAATVATWLGGIAQ